MIFNSNLSKYKVPIIIKGNKNKKREINQVYLLFLINIKNNTFLNNYLFFLNFFSKN